MVKRNPTLLARQRQVEILRLLRTGRKSGLALATQLGVRVETIHRDLAALRSSGYCIFAMGDVNGWCYELLNDSGE